MSVEFWGVRGSAPISGESHQIFGGQTTCLEINAGGRRVIVDAGSGIRQLGQKLKRSGVATVDIVLTHYHMDHLMGLMTFAPFFEKGTAVTIHAPILDNRHPEAILNVLLDAPYSPMAAKDAGSSFDIRCFQPGDVIAVGDLEIPTTCLSHPGGACGYRIGNGEESIAVIMDHEHSSHEPDASLVKFCAGADLILYDSHWDEELDYQPHRGWGHSTWQAGLRLLGAAGARRLGTLHHAPDAQDAVLLAREGRLRQAHSDSFFAREGDVVHV